MRIALYLLIAVLISAPKCIEVEKYTSSQGDVIQSTKQFLVRVVDPSKEQLRLYWKNGRNEKLKTFQNLKKLVESNNQELLFAMNAGMYTKERSPLGLYVESGKVLRKLNTVKKATGNFYMQPNGVFYILESGLAGVCKSTEYPKLNGVEYASQSGPMLLIDGVMHPAFTNGSKHVHIRNAVGILPDGKAIFVLSKERINFWDLASYFKTLGCQNALYLDGFVSRVYDPKQDWVQLEGSFGSMIAIIK